MDDGWTVIETVVPCLVWSNSVLRGWAACWMKVGMTDALSGGCGSK